MATNYEKYFGSPEKVADTIDGRGFDQCEVCKVANGDECETYDKCSMNLLEWLQEECDD